MGWVGRLRLAGHVGVEEGEDRPALPAEAARETRRLLDHGGDLRVRLRRRQVAGADGGEAVHLIDDDQAGGLAAELQPRRRDRQGRRHLARQAGRSEEHTSELQSLMRISYAVCCSKKKTTR